MSIDSSREGSWRFAADLAGRELVGRGAEIVVRAFGVLGFGRTEKRRSSRWRAIPDRRCGARGLVKAETCSRCGASEAKMGESAPSFPSAPAGVQRDWSQPIGINT